MVKKRINVVRTNLVREKSILYEPRKITKPEDAVRLAQNVIGEADRENFVIIALNTKNEFNQIEITSIGTVNSALVHPREVFTGLILSKASSFIAIHNHPSSDVSPSNEDRKITERLEASGALLGIPMLDHIIIGEDKYFSFKEEKEKEDL
jgi:DNA repair protein RadC